MTDNVSSEGSIVAVFQTSGCAAWANLGRIVYLWIVALSIKWSMDFIIRTTLAKPLVMLSILDYVFCDFIRIGRAILCLHLAAYSWIMCHIPINYPMAFVVSWTGVFLVHWQFIHMNFGVIIRYLHIQQNRMIMDYYTDEDARQAILGIGIALSSLLTLTVMPTGSQPSLVYQFIHPNGDIASNEPHVLAYTFGGLVLLSIVLNLTLNAVIHFKEAHSTPTSTNASSKSDMLTLGFLLAMALGILGLVVNFLLDSPAGRTNMDNTLATFTVGGLFIPMTCIVMKTRVRKQVLRNGKVWALKIKQLAQSPTGSRVSPAWEPPNPAGPIETE